MDKKKEYVDLGKETWTMEIRPSTSFFQLNIKEILEYKDLIFLFVQRDFKTMYKQTILGPAWILIRPLLTTVVFTVVFGRIASISTDGVPDFLFYMAGNILWSYFSGCLQTTANAFLGNARLFGKVYFPRVVMPISVSLSKLITFGAQFLLLLLFVVWYQYRGGVQISWFCRVTPLVLLQRALLAIGTGMILASFTTKYRDLQVLVDFGIQLWMYATPVVYPMSEIPKQWQWIILLNPAAPAVECFRYGWLGSGTFPIMWFSIACVITVGIALLGMLLFNRTQRTFMDTV